tara:strand:+ start:100 stop:489 length:390 start_codon:yes stop_codon:yes gene_type:complete
LKTDNIKIGSNKNFGIVFFIFFLLVSFFPLLQGGSIKIWSLVVSIIFLILGLLNSPLLTILNKAWFKFGILLGNLVSPIVLGIIFFTIVTPTSLIMKLLGKNLLDLKNNNKKSYWIERPKIKSKMRDQF